MTGEDGEGVGNRWLEGGGRRGEKYDDAFDRLARSGADVHGEAAFVLSLGARSVLDAGCGTGRVAIELARRGLDVAGVDVDPAMLDAARLKAPDLEWHLGDIATVNLGRAFDAVVMAGNVMVFLAPETEGAVVANLARHLATAGVLVAGFQLSPGRLTIEDYDRHCAAAGLEQSERWATWDRDPWREGREYAVSVHHRA